MYRFKKADGKEARIYFSHRGGKKGENGKAGKAPHMTICSIISEEDKLLGSGQASPLGTIREELPAGFTSNTAQKYYGNRFKRISIGPDGKVYAVLKGDKFCRAKGREESLREALETLPKEDRQAAWVAIGKIVVEDDEEIIDLVDQVA